ncbi:MAG TPA: arginase family protein [Solirubrobacterales bacterium]|jgi:arginase
MSEAIGIGFHLDQPVEGFAAAVGAGRMLDAEPPPGEQWQRVAALQERLAEAVAAEAAPATVISADCPSGVGVLAGRRRAGEDPGVVWFDAHGDFNTEETTETGYLGGFPLAEISGRGERRVASALGLEPLADERILLVGARDLDRAEAELLAGSGVRRAAVEELAAGGVELPAGPLYLHLDIDVADPSYAPGLNYQVPGGPAEAALEAAVATVAASGRLAAVNLALNSDPLAPGAERTLALGRRLLAAVVIELGPDPPR